MGGLFNGEIAAVLVYLKRHEDAVPYLTKSLYSGYFELLNAVASYAEVYLKRRDYVSAADILEWGIRTLEGLSNGKDIGYIDKLHASMLFLLAGARLRTAGEEQALKTMKAAAELAGRFDESPDFGFSSLKYLQAADLGSSHDVNGATAAESIANLLGELEDAEISRLWKEATENE